MRPWDMKPGESQEHYTWRKREERNLKIWSFVGFVALGAIILGLMLLHAVVVYDDWRCAFGDCRIVK
jgi:hypothetical protein